jgi:hypothetical protein
VRRGEKFHLLIDGPEGEFIIDGIDTVVDCSGVLGNHNHVGRGAPRHTNENGTTIQ